MSASLDSTSTEDNVPVLKPKDLSLVPSPLFLGLQQTNHQSLN